MLFRSIGGNLNIQNLNQATTTLELSASEGTVGVNNMGDLTVKQLISSGAVSLRSNMGSIRLQRVVNDGRLRLTTPQGSVYSMPDSDVRLNQLQLFSGGDVSLNPNELDLISGHVGGNLELILTGTGPTRLANDQLPLLKIGRAHV